jgi:OOP family OmpA-OmpF porin
MQRIVTPVLSIVMMLGLGLADAGCAPAPPPPARAPRVKHVRIKPAQTVFDMNGEVLKLPGPVVFQSGSDKLDPVSDTVLEVVADYLSARPNVTLLRIEGHTDSDGAPAGNQVLSEKRAMAVAQWITNTGIDCHRLHPVGFGQDKPVVPNTSPENKAQNRRVAFINAAVNGKALGGPPDAGGRNAGDPCR